MSYEILENSLLVMLMASALRHVAITYALLADFIGCVGEIYRLEIVQRRKELAHGVDHVEFSNRLVSRSDWQ